MSQEEKNEIIKAIRENADTILDIYKEVLNLPAFQEVMREVFKLQSQELVKAFATIEKH